MAHITQNRVGGAVIPGAYSKMTTEGDAYRFSSAEAGYAQIMHRDDDTQVDDGRARVTVGPNWPPPTNRPEYLDFVLDFRYIVGVNQLEVFVVTNNSVGQTVRIVRKDEIERARQAYPSWPSGDLDPSGVNLLSFEESGSDAVRIHNPSSAYDMYLFVVPHTSLQAATRDRLMVRDQGDNIGIELLGLGNGILLRSENGRRGILRLDNQGGVGVDPA